MEIRDEKETKELLEEVMAGFNQFRLSDRGRAELRKFFQFKLNYREGHGRALRYNLLIQCEYKEEADKFVQTILEGLDTLNLLSSYQTIRGTEKELGEEFTKSRRPKSLDDSAAIVITEGSPIRRDSVQIISSKMRGDLERERKEKDEFWNRIRGYSEKKPDGLVIAVGPKGFQDYIRENDELFYRVLAHHIRIRSWTDEDVIRAVELGLQEEGLDASKGFQTKIEKYIRVVYPKAELQNSVFVDDLLNRILVSYYTNPRKGKLTENYVPYYRRPRSIDKVFDEFDQLVGLEKVKKGFKDLYYLGAQNLSDSQNKITGRFHFAFVGNPGTGKTTVARLTAELLYSMGVITRNKLVCVKPTDVIGVYRGDAPNLMQEKIDEARGGVLFIDEAYFLNSNTNDSESKGVQCLTVLLQEMENHPDELSVIFAGYKEDIASLLKFPGLGSRVPYIFEFDDYTDEELLQIFENVAEREGLFLAKDARDVMLDRIAQAKAEDNFGNARTMEVIYQQLKSRYLEQKREDSTITAEDIQSTMPTTIYKNLDDMIGLKKVKQELTLFESRVKYIKYLKDQQLTVPTPNMHMLFTGNPGTGKTTVARKLADCLYRIGVLKTNKIVIAERKDLVGDHVGETATKTAAVIQKAMNGVLFIDEAYSLAPLDRERDFGSEAIETLIPAMENYKDCLVIVFAGYLGEMERFVDSNPGIASRIGFTFHFPNYSPDELTEMFKRKMDGYGFDVKDSAAPCVRKIMEYFIPMENFGNGRFVDKIIDMTINKRAGRSYEKQYNDIAGEDIPTVQEVIDVAVKGYQMTTDEEQSKESRYRTAVHEAGHAIVNSALNLGKVTLVSIHADAASLGRTGWDSAGRDCTTEKYLRDRLVSLLAGRNAEKLILGDHSTGVFDDFQRAKQLANAMVEQVAMGNLGVATAMGLIQTADMRATALLKKNKDKLKQLADLLYQKGTLDESDLKNSGLLEGLVG